MTAVMLAAVCIMGLVCTLLQSGKTRFDVGTALAAANISGARRIHRTS
jgi:hypothetical protein